MIQEDLGVSPEEFDKQYLAVDERELWATAANFDEWRKALEHLVAAAKQKQYDAVMQEGEAVRPHVSRVHRGRERL